jgi:hypothetical protein
MTVTVVVKGEKSKSSFVKCPLCTDYIARDAIAYAAHMCESHAAYADTFTDPTWYRDGFPPYNTVGSPGPCDDNPTRIKYPEKCYGCGAEFSTAAALLVHLSSVHIEVGGA